MRPSAFAFSTTRAAPSAHILPRTQRARNGPGRGRLGGLALAPQRSAAAGGWEGLTCPSRSVIRKALEKKITFGYGLAVQARSMSSRKESNRWPRMQFTLSE